MARLKKGAVALCFCSQLVASADGMVLIGSIRRESSRYFTVQQTLPPLSRHMASFANHTEILPYSSHGESLPVTYTNNPKIVSQWLSNHVPDSNGILGFDVESVPDCPWVKKTASFQGPATVQLATTTSCLVVHLTSRKGRPSRACAPILEAILADESIVKAGAGIDQDMLELWECWGRLEARSRLELGGIGSSTKTGNSIIGLQRLTSSIVGVDLRKTKKRALTDWSQVPLTQDQLAYSARDAWAGAAVVAELSRVDPDTFGTAALLDMLKSEQPIQDLYKAAKQRKHAKMQLSTLLHHNVRSPKQSSRKKMPPKVKQKVSKLRRILEQTTRGGPMVFNVEPLGFTIQSKQ